MSPPVCGAADIALERLSAEERKQAYAAIGKLANRFPGRVGQLAGQIVLDAVDSYLTMGYRVDQASPVPSLIRALLDEER